MKHYITKYTMEGVKYVTSWIQINVFGWPICFSKRTIALG